MSPSILVVDDDPRIRKLIATTLDDVAGCVLREAGSGAEALHAAARDRPRIVFLDHDMPHLDGVETCRRLRSDPVTADAVVVMLTGMSSDRFHARAADAGVDVLLPKPFSPLRLLRLVDELATHGAVR